MGQKVKFWETGPGLLLEASWEVPVSLVKTESTRAQPDLEDKSIVGWKEKHEGLQMSLLGH